MKLLKYLVCVIVLVSFFSLYAQEDSEKKDGEAVKKTDNIEQVEKPAEAQNPTIDEGGFNIKLRNLEEKINSLKDKIFRAKQRLSVLQETVLSGALAGSRATIVHKNDVGSAFELVSAIYYLDDAPVFKKVDAPQELNNKEIVVFDGSVVPGPHHVSVFLQYRGKGFGIFSYMEGYTYKIKAGHSFNIDEGYVAEVISIPKDHGSAVKLDNRLYLNFDVQKKVYQRDEAAEQQQLENSEQKSETPAKDAGAQSEKAVQ